MGGEGARAEMMRNAPVAPGTAVGAAGPPWAHKHLGLYPGLDLFSKEAS